MSSVGFGTLWLQSTVGGSGGGVACPQDSYLLAAGAEVGGEGAQNVLWGLGHRDWGSKTITLLQLSESSASK